MKKLLIATLAITLVGASLMAFAQDRPSPSSNCQDGTMSSVDMQTMHKEMQQKMLAAKTDEESQALMTEHHKLMQAKHGHMMPMHADGHSMDQMPGHMFEHRMMMQKKMSVTS
mgnify:CR=1 FL=1|jgi:hypothetical protein